MHLWNSISFCTREDTFHWSANFAFRGVVFRTQFTFNIWSLRVTNTQTQHSRKRWHCDRKGTRSTDIVAELAHPNSRIASRCCHCKAQCSIASVVTIQMQTNPSAALGSPSTAQTAKRKLLWGVFCLSNRMNLHFSWNQADALSHQHFNVETLSRPEIQYKVVMIAIEYYSWIMIDMQIHSLGMSRFFPAIIDRSYHCMLFTYKRWCRWQYRTNRHSSNLFV